MRSLLLGLGIFAMAGTCLAQSDNWAKVQDRNLVDLRRSLEEIPLTLSSRQLWLSRPVLTVRKHSGDHPAKLAAAPVPAAWNYQELAFFCKLEVKMEKALRLPVKFRLGEVQTVEKMEGKLKTYFIDNQ